MDSRDVDKLLQRIYAAEQVKMTPRRIYDPLTGKQITADDFFGEIILLQRHIDAACDERTKEIYRQVLAKRQQELAELSS